MTEYLCCPCNKYLVRDSWMGLLMSGYSVSWYEECHLRGDETRVEFDDLKDDHLGVYDDLIDMYPDGSCDFVCKEDGETLDLVRDMQS